MPEPEENDVQGEVAALRRELKLTWGAHEREHGQHELSHSREHKFAQDAIDKAAEMAKENKADANEWRAAMTDREKRFATKEDTDRILQRLDSIERGNLVDAQRERSEKDAAAERERSEKEAAASRQTRAMWTVGIMATIGSILVGAILRLSGN